MNGRLLRGFIVRSLQKPVCISQDPREVALADLGLVLRMEGGLGTTGSKIIITVSGFNSSNLFKTNQNDSEAFLLERGKSHIGSKPEQGRITCNPEVS